MKLESVREEEVYNHIEKLFEIEVDKNKLNKGDWSPDQEIRLCKCVGDIRELLNEFVEQNK